jgi:hypothetical protein
MARQFGPNWRVRQSGCDAIHLEAKEIRRPFAIAHRHNGGVFNDRSGHARFCLPMPSRLCDQDGRFHIVMVAIDEQLDRTV